MHLSTKSHLHSTVLCFLTATAILDDSHLSPVCSTLSFSSHVPGSTTGMSSWLSFTTFKLFHLTTNHTVLGNTISEPILRRWCSEARPTPHSSRSCRPPWSWSCCFSLPTRPPCCDSRCSLGLPSWQYAFSRVFSLHVEFHHSWSTCKTKHVRWKQATQTTKFWKPNKK